MDDNMYPNDGTFFVPTIPEERKTEEKKQKAEVLEALPLLKEMIEYFDKQIANLENVHAYPKEVLDNPEVFMHHVAAYQIASQFIKDKREYLINLKEKYAKKR